VYRVVYNVTVTNQIKFNFTLGYHMEQFTNPQMSRTAHLS